LAGLRGLAGGGAARPGQRYRLGNALDARDRGRLRRRGGGRPRLAAVRPQGTGPERTGVRAMTIATGTNRLLVTTTTDLAEHHQRRGGLPWQDGKGRLIPAVRDAG